MLILIMLRNFFDIFIDKNCQKCDLNWVYLCKIDLYILLWHVLMNLTSISISDSNVITLKDKQNLLWIKKQKQTKLLKWFWKQLHVKVSILFLKDG
jgi:hypothetical protein